MRLIFLFRPRPEKIPVWHLVGGLDPLDESELKGDEPQDGYPVHLEEWIEADGLNCLKIKLRGNDSNWDYERLRSIGCIAEAKSVEYLTTDFNCTVTDPAYANKILDRLEREAPETHRKILYVEQPFPYDLEAHRIRFIRLRRGNPFMDESAMIGSTPVPRSRAVWTGVALKTCKTQTGALLSLCWAKAHGMDLMVQDLTNPMLAQVPHVLLGAHAGTIMGVESNGMQFYPEASVREARVHPGIYSRSEGSSIFPPFQGRVSATKWKEFKRRPTAKPKRFFICLVSCHHEDSSRENRSVFSFGKVDFPLVGSFRATGLARVLPGLLLASLSFLNPSVLDRRQWRPRPQGWGG